MKNDGNAKVEDSLPNISESSFLVRVRYRQNASWQGMIQWLDGKKTRNFRSFLEMVLLMQEALTNSIEADTEIKFHNWKENEDVS